MTNFHRRQNFLEFYKKKKLREKSRSDFLNKNLPCFKGFKSPVWDFSVISKLIHSFPVPSRIFWSTSVADPPVSPSGGVFSALIYYLFPIKKSLDRKSPSSLSKSEVFLKNPLSDFQYECKKT